MNDEDYDWAIDYTYVSEYPEPDGIREEGHLTFKFGANARNTYEYMSGRVDTYESVRLLRRPKQTGWEVVE